MAGSKVSDKTGAYKVICIFVTDCQGIAIFLKIDLWDAENQMWLGILSRL